MHKHLICSKSSEGFESRKKLMRAVSICWGLRPATGLVDHIRHDWLVKANLTALAHLWALTAFRFSLQKHNNLANDEDRQVANKVTGFGSFPPRLFAARVVRVGLTCWWPQDRKASLIFCLTTFQTFFFLITWLKVFVSLCCSWKIDWGYISCPIVILAYLSSIRLT